LGHFVAFSSRTKTSSASFGNVLSLNCRSSHPSAYSDAMAAFVPVGGLSVKFVGFRASSCASLPVRAPRLVVSRSAVAAPITAKMFDWKNRADPNYNKLEGDGIFKFNNLRPAPGSKHRKKRKGRGDAAGQGGACGFGMRGQKSRSGRPSRPGFEGGQTPMGPGHKKTEYALMKMEFLNGCEENSIVTFSSLFEAGLMTKQKRKLVKVTGGTELAVKGLTVKAHAFTTSAVETIEAAGGTCVLVSPTTGKDIVVVDDSEAS
jgi:large subunit ribosomal protein L15